MSDDKTNAAIERLERGARPLPRGQPLGRRKAPPSWRDVRVLLDEVRRLRSLGIVELGAENREVLEYMEHWETRAEQAEAERDEARAEIERLRAKREKVEKIQRYYLALAYDNAPDVDKSDEGDWVKWGDVVKVFG